MRSAQRESERASERASESRKDKGEQGERGRAATWSCAGEGAREQPSPGSTTRCHDRTWHSADMGREGSWPACRSRDTCSVASAHVRSASAVSRAQQNLPKSTSHRASRAPGGTEKGEGPKSRRPWLFGAGRVSCKLRSARAARQADTGSRPVQRANSCDKVLARPPRRPRPRSPSSPPSPSRCPRHPHPRHRDRP
eukprot:3185297-Rhodomonas_salina.1